MSIPQPPAPPPAPGLPAGAAPTEDGRSQNGRRLLGDAAGAVALLLALLVVFLLDRNASGRSAALARRMASTTIFDPLVTPLAEVRVFSKERWIGGFGGSDASEAAVRLGLEWLARHQAPNGHWGPDCLHPAPEGCCRKPESCPGGGHERRIAQTGLAILAFQAAGHYDFNGNEYSARVRRGLDWLLANQRADGRFLDLEPARTRYCDMYDHGSAAFALADACEMARSSGQEPADRYGQAAARAVRFIEYAQHSDGGWRYSEERELPSDTSVSGWQVLAMKAAKRAGIAEVGPSFVGGVEAFFKRCELGERGRTGYQRGLYLSDATTGVGMLVHQFILEKPDSPLVRAGAQYLADGAKSSAGSVDFYTWYNCTLAMFQAGGEPWKRWNDAVRNRLVALQRHKAESCTDGSWDPEGRGAEEGGRIYSTALAVLTLEVYYRYKSQGAQVYEKP